MTIQQINNKSFQEIFDFVANHLLTQNERAFENEMCCYRAGNLKCAVGALIADEDYDCNFENKSLLSLRNELEKSIFSYIEDNKVILLNQLQCIHDSYGPESWLERLSLLAKELTLNDEILKKFEVNEKH
jgi:hypothetical protein